MTIAVTERGLEIDHNGDKALSAVIERAGFAIDIGEDWSNSHGPERPQGFQRYTAMTLTRDEAEALYQWLGEALSHNP